MDWKTANKAVVWIGPAVPAFYAGFLSVSASVADSSETAKGFIEKQVDLISKILSSSLGIISLAILFIVWAAIVWITDFFDGRQKDRENSIISLANRADTCAQGIVRLVVLHKHREAVAMQHAWASQGDRDYFIQSASLMGDYAVLYSHEALVIVKAAIRQGVHISDYAEHAVEHPVNPLGIEEVARTLAIVADKLKSRDLNKPKPLSRPSTQA